MYSLTAIEQLKKGTILEQTLLGQKMYFKTHYGVFSPKAVDSGTLLLLDYLDYENGQTMLDLGCGYGVIGISLAKVCPNSALYLVDKDFIAVELSKKNMVLNEVDNVKVQLSDGLQQLDNHIRFDHIISNMPAKVGKEQMAIFLHDSYQQLNSGGRLTIVTINGLKEYIKRNFNAVFGNYKKIKQGRDYTVSTATKN